MCDNASLVQDSSNPNANALELLQSCIKPSECYEDLQLSPNQEHTVKSLI